MRSLGVELEAERQRISSVTGGAAADGAVIAAGALGVLTAHGTALRLATHARIDALVAVTALVSRTISVFGALSLGAGHQRIAQVSFTAEANGTVGTALVLARLAIGIRPARIRAAQFIFIEGSTAIERMTGVPFGATADGHVVLGFAFGVDAAHSLTGIAAFQIETGLIAVALFVLGAFGKTANEWIAQEILRARAHRAVIQNATTGVESTGDARIAAAIVETGLVTSAGGVVLALVPTAFDGVAEVAVQTGADGARAHHPALGVCAARRRRAQVVTCKLGSHLGDQ